MADRALFDFNRVTGKKEQCASCGDPVCKSCVGGLEGELDDNGEEEDDDDAQSF